MVPIVPASGSLFGALSSVSPTSSSSSMLTDAMGGVTSAASSSSSVPSMGIGLSGASGISPLADLTNGVGATTTAPFADVLTEAVGQVAKLEKQSRAAVEGLMSGKGVDVHEAMIATEKAEMGFDLMLAVRNKALAAYQQVIGMQF